MESKGITDFIKNAAKPSPAGHSNQHHQTYNNNPSYSTNEQYYNHNNPSYTTNDQYHNSNNPHPQHNGAKPSASKVASSAKVLLDAAVTKLHKTESDNAQGKASKAQVAAAASDVLAAARHYGKLDDKNSAGKYARKAEEYLHKYGGAAHSAPSHTNNPYAGHTQNSHHDGSAYGPYAPPMYAHAHGAQQSAPPVYAHAYGAQQSAPPVHGHGHAAQQGEDKNKYMKYLKKAEEYLKKQ